MSINQTTKDKIHRNKYYLLPFLTTAVLMLFYFQCLKPKDIVAVADKIAPPLNSERFEGAIKLDSLRQLITEIQEKYPRVIQDATPKGDSLQLTINKDSTSLVQRIFYNREKRDITPTIAFAFVEKDSAVIMPYDILMSLLIASGK